MLWHEKWDDQTLSHLYNLGATFIDFVMVNVISITNHNIMVISLYIKLASLNGAMHNNEKCYNLILLH